MRFSILHILSVFIFIHCSSTSKKIDVSEKTNSSIPSKGNVSISWNPNVLKEDFIVESLSVFKNVDIGIKPLSDSRLNKETIGTIIYNGQPIAAIPKTDIADWCSKNLLKGCQFLGLKPVARNGAYSFEGELTSFSIQQSITMTGEISMSLSCNRDDLTVWEGRIQGHSELYIIPPGSNGVSECMSNSLINALYNLLNDKSFVDAISKSSH